MDMEHMIDLIVNLFPRKIAHALVSRYSEFLFKNVDKSSWKRTAENIVRAFGGSITLEQARDISLNSFKNLTHFMADYRYMARNDFPTLKDAVANVECQGQENIIKAIQAGLPIITASIHMGNFIFGFLKLCEYIPKGFKVTVIKWKEWTSKEEAAYRHFRAAGVDVNVLRLGEQPGLGALRALRAGNTVLTLCDVVPPGVPTVEVDFLNAKARFPRGPAELALSCHGIILPVFTARGRDQALFIRVEEPIPTTSLLNGRNIGEAAQYITQSLVSKIESWIRQYPEQWQYWPIADLLWKTN